MSSVLQTDQLLLLEDLRSALVRLLARDQRNTCQHEETSRGGAIWTICDFCGMRWADDKGGKPAWVDPPEWVAAEAALDSFNKTFACSKSLRKLDEIDIQLDALTSQLNGIRDEIRKK